MQLFKAAWDENKNVVYLNLIYKCGVWAVVYNKYYVYTIGHIPSGVVLNCVLKSEQAINLCRELSNIDENFDNECEFGKRPKFSIEIFNILKEKGIC